MLFVEAEGVRVVLVSVKHYYCAAKIDCWPVLDINITWLTAYAWLYSTVYMTVFIWFI